MQWDFDVIIIGAGPAGSTAAILLARAGWSVALIEKRPFPRRKVCGECIAAGNLPLFDALGIGDAFAAMAGPELRRFAVWCGSRAASAPLPALVSPRYAWGRSLGRDQLDELLLQRARAAGARVLQPCTARSLEGEPGQFRCAVSAAGAARPSMLLRAPVAIAAHGSEATAQRFRDHSSRSAENLLAFKANFSDAQLAPGLLPVLSFRGGYGGMVLADHGRVTVACCIRTDRLAALRAQSKGAQAGTVVEDYLRRECAAAGAALAGASRTGPWLATGPLRPGNRMRRAVGGAFLIGNAAGEAHPIIGEGISMAIQSACLLCAQLVRNQAALLRAGSGGDLQQSIQRHYAALWHAHFSRRMRMASWFAWAAMHPALTEGFVQLCRMAPPVLTSCARWSGKVQHAPRIAAISQAPDGRAAGEVHDRAGPMPPGQPAEHEP